MGESASNFGIMWTDPRIIDQRPLAQRLELSRDSVQVSTHQLRDTRKILNSSMEAIQRSHERIRESDRILSQYILLPEEWRR